MSIVIALLVALLVPPSDVEADGLASTAPAYFDRDTAREHITAARIAGAVFRVRASDLLAIAHHESRYSVREVTREPGGRFSCGVMTPKPIARCEPWMLELLGGYMHGAHHLREWMDLCERRLLTSHRPRACALNGYAGNSEDGQNPGVRTWQTFDRRARMIEKAMRGRR